MMVRLRPHNVSNKLQQLQIQMRSNTNIRTFCASMRVNRRVSGHWYCSVFGKRAYESETTTSYDTASNINTIKFKYTNNHTNVQTVRPGPTRATSLIPWRSTTQSRHCHCSVFGQHMRIGCDYDIILHQTPINNTFKFKHTIRSNTTIRTSCSSIVNRSPFNTCSAQNQHRSVIIAIACSSEFGQHNMSVRLFTVSNVPIANNTFKFKQTGMQTYFLFVEDQHGTIPYMHSTYAELPSNNTQEWDYCLIAITLISPSNCFKHT